MKLLKSFRHCEQREAIPLGSPRRFAPRDDELKRGFTLIELLIVFSLIGLLTVSSFIAFTSYNRTQTFETSSSEVVQMLSLAKSRALTQVKPTQCGTQVLNGYQVSFSAPGTAYHLNVICGGTLYTLERKNLPTNLSFTPPMSFTVFFAVSTGTVATQRAVRITGYGKTKLIIISKTGSISVQ